MARLHRLRRGDRGPGSPRHAPPRRIPIYWLTGPSRVGVPGYTDRSRSVRGSPDPGGDTMPRAMWKGAISFGLVTIPVAVYPATEEKTLRFNQLHDEDGGRIRYKRVCEKDGEEVSFEHIVKGYEVEKDRY